MSRQIRIQRRPKMTLTKSFSLPSQNVTQVSATFPGRNMQNTENLHFPPKETPTHSNLPEGTINITENGERIRPNWRHSGEWNNIELIDDKNIPNFRHDGNWNIPNLRHSGDWNIPNPNIITEMELSNTRAVVRSLDSKNPQNHSFGIPTLFVCGILSGILSLICYVITHKLSISEDFPSVHYSDISTNEDLYNYKILVLMNVMKTKLNAGLEFSNQHSWILGPIFCGSAVTLVTWRVLNPEEKRPVRPSLQLGKFVSVLNGIVVGLYLVSYNLKINL